MSMANTDYLQVWNLVRQWPPDLREHLAQDIRQSLEADAPVADGEWNETKNARRCELIDKEIQETLTVVERVELDALQRQAVAYRDRVAPLPMDGARKLHRDLLEKAGGSEPGS